jgi:hypothetical protein
MTLQNQHLKPRRNMKNKLIVHALFVSLVTIPTLTFTGCETSKPKRPHKQVVNAPKGAKPQKLPGKKSPKDNGCWVRIWQDENHTGNTDTIFGPGTWNNMRTLPNATIQDWGDKISAIIVGPHATIVGWEDENYGDDAIQFGPNSVISRLGEYNFDNEIDSLQINYAP